MKALLSSRQTITINEMQMYYVIHGQGEPLVLLHGYTGSSGDWEVFLLFYNLREPFIKTVVSFLRGDWEQQ